MFEEHDGTIRSFPVSFTNGEWDIIRTEGEGEETSYIVSENGTNGETGNKVLAAKSLDGLQGIEGYR